MALHRNALITKAEQAKLIDLLGKAKADRASLAHAESAYNRFLSDHAPSHTGMMIDHFGDGREKPASEIKRMGGKRPPVLGEKLNEERAQGAKPPPVRPPPASIGDRAQALNLYTARQLAQAVYGKSGQAFDDKLNRYSKRPLCRIDQSVDVFGDGLLKRTVDCTWPAPLEVRKGKLVA